MKKFINIILRSGELQTLPIIYDTKQMAQEALNDAVCNYSTPHMKALITLEVELPDDRRPEETPHRCAQTGRGREKHLAGIAKC